MNAGRQQIVTELKKIIVGQDEVISQALMTLFVGGNSLIVGAPGLAKTLLIHTMARVLDLKFSRIQFTPDLMPSDITGTDLVQEDATTGRRQMVFAPGPIFANIVLADEINRTPPKTQSALLEAMQEHHVTVGGQTYPLPEPFFVLATQNPLEMEGTYPLPEAQLDRFFFKVHVPFPSTSDLIEIANRTTGARVPQTRKIANAAMILEMQNLARTVPIASHVLAYAARVITATHPEDKDASPAARQYVRYGASPRGMQALILAGKIMALLDGRFNVAFADLKLAALPALRHRVILNFEAQAEGIAADDVIRQVVETVKAE
jgi:MoxR-like ATPase